MGERDPDAVPPTAGVSRRPIHIPWRGSLRELLVVFVGVLLALVVNSAYSNWQDRRLEHYYLEQLRSAVERDTAQWAVTAQLLQAKREALALLDAAFSRQDTSVADTLVIRAMVEAELLSWSTPFPRSTDTFEELRSTGRLALIRDPALRATVSVYNDRLVEEQQRVEGARMAYNSRTFALIPPGLRNRFEPDLPGAFRRRSPSWPLRSSLPSGGELEVQRMARATVEAARRSDFQSAVNAETARADFLEGMLARLNRLSLDLLRQLDSELRRTGSQPS